MKIILKPRSSFAGLLIGKYCIFPVTNKTNTARPTPFLNPDKSSKCAFLLSMRIPFQKLLFLKYIFNTHVVRHEICRYLGARKYIDRKCKRVNKIIILKEQNYILFLFRGLKFYISFSSVIRRTKTIDVTKWDILPKI